MTHYTVKRGDSWFSIAKQFGRGYENGVRELVEANGRKLNRRGRVIGGQTLGEIVLNPGAPPWGKSIIIPWDAPPIYPPGFGQLYRVRHRDTPKSIALYCRLGDPIEDDQHLVDELLGANPHKRMPVPMPFEGEEFFPTIILSSGEWIRLPLNWDCPPHRASW